METAEYSLLSIVMSPMQAGIKTSKRHTCTRFFPSNRIKYRQVIKLLEHKYCTNKNTSKSKN